MKLNEVLTPLLIKHDLKKYRGAHLRKLVKGQSKKANPIEKGAIYNPATCIVPGPAEQGMNSGLC